MELASWLEQNGLERYTEIFADNDVDMEILPSLTEVDLKELGVSLGHRRKIQRLLSDLLPSEPATPNPESAAVDSSTPSATLSPQQAEHRQLTVMFCDLADSTQLSFNLEVEAYRSLILSYQNLCGHAVQTFDGYLARFFGDGALVYFGYPIAHEDAAERAVRTAMLIHDSLNGLRAGQSSVSARIGIATGPVVVGDIIGEGASQQSTALGETPNLASRLQSIAQRGETVVADNSRRLMLGQFEFESLGKHDFKGIEKPVSAWRVISEQFADSRFDSMRGESVAEIVGRDEEIETLWRRWLQASNGHGQVVELSGEAGIGKSRVVRGLQDKLTRVDHNVVSFQSSQHHTSTPLFPFITQITRAAKISAEDSTNVKSKKIDQLFCTVDHFDQASRASLLDLLSIANLDFDDAISASNLRATILQAIVNYLQMHCQDLPTLFVFEDVQWIDPTSIDLLELLVAGAVLRNMMILITLRKDYKSSWGGEAHVTTMVLNKLPLPMCEMLVRKVSGNRMLPKELVHEILNKTDGVPLFIEELTATIIESGMVRLEGDQYVLDQPITSLTIPMTIQDSLMARLDRLASVKDLAQIGSVIGREFNHELLASVAAMPDLSLIHI